MVENEGGGKSFEDYFRKINRLQQGLMYLLY